MATVHIPASMAVYDLVLCAVLRSPPVGSDSGNNEVVRMPRGGNRALPFDPAGNPRICEYVFAARSGHPDTAASLMAA